MGFTQSISLIVCMKIVSCLTSNMPKICVHITCLASIQNKLNTAAVSRMESKTGGAIYSRSCLFFVDTNCEVMGN